MPRRGNNEGTIRRRPDGRWEARVSVNGQQRSVYGKTRQAVATRMREIQRAAEQGLPLANERLTVAAFLTEWLDTAVRPSVRPRTYTSYSTHVRRYLIPALGSIPLVKLQPEHVQRLVNDLLASGLSPNTVLRVRATLRRALNQAMRWGRVSRNVATLIDPPKATRFRVEPLTMDEASQLMAAAEQHRLGALFTLQLAVGLRLGEVLGLRWSDVNLDVGELTVRQALQRVHGRIEFVEPKSETSRRTVNIPGFAVTALRRHRAAQNRERLRAANLWQDSGLVFCTELGRPLDPSNANHAFRRLLASAGLRHIRTHDLRHACASFLLAQGMNPRVVMEVLGHSQISLTLNTYSHVLPSLKREAAERMDELLGGRIARAE